MGVLLQLESIQKMQQNPSLYCQKQLAMVWATLRSMRREIEIHHQFCRSTYLLTAHLSKDTLGFILKISKTDLNLLKKDFQKLYHCSLFICLYIMLNIMLNYFNK